MSLECLAAARAALARGDVLIAYDEASAALAIDGDDLEAHYMAALALARSGALHRAVEDAARLRRRVGETRGVPVRLCEDVDALDARIAKTLALEAVGEGRAALLRDAADRYGEVARRYGRHYACINAATLRLLAGDVAKARDLARRARALAGSEGGDGDETGYWRAATEAEAGLVLGDLDGARAALVRAAAVADEDLAARAATRQQLALVCEATGISSDVLEPLNLPMVIHYCGHVARPAGGSTRFPLGEEQRVAAEVAQFLEQYDVGFAYGSLASGADILAGEAILARGSELRVVLPFDTREFEEISVRPGGARWVERFRACLARAESVSHACDSAYLGDDSLFAYASWIAMGHAINRAGVLGTTVEQLAVWDGLEARGPGGTADDVAVWRRAGGHTHVVSTTAAGSNKASAAPASSRDSSRDSSRAVRAILFADLHGFSRLRDEQYPAVLEQLFTPLARVLDRFGDAALWRNSWGDAIVVVFRDVAAAAGCALELQEAAGLVDLARAGLPDDVAWRVGVHAGPVLCLPNPFLATTAIWGREMTRAARIEPRTPEGEVYTTDAFAALLALEPDSGFSCEYVGRVTTAKDFETIPMYRLRRRAQPGLATVRPRA